MYLYNILIYNGTAAVITLLLFLKSLSGFSDHSPEEIRLEYYSSRASGDLQSYVSALLLNNVYTVTSPCWTLLLYIEMFINLFNVLFF